MNEDDIIEIMADKTQKFKNVYIKNFGITMSEEELKQMFEPYGKITSLKIMTDVRGESRGFGFVCYQNSDEAEKAVEKLNDIVIDGKTLYVGRAQKKSERQAEIMEKNEEIRKNNNMQYDGLNVYVNNLDRSISDKRLRNEFSQFGTISSAKVMTTEDGRSKEFGFVCFSSPEEANKAVTEMNGIILADKALYVCLAQRKDVRKAILSTQYLQNNGHNFKMSRMFPPDEPGYLLPTITQVQRNFYSPIFAPNSSRIPRWQARLKQPQPGFQNLPGPHRGAHCCTNVRAKQAGQVNIGTPATLLANANEQEYKQMLGQRLFLPIQNIFPDLAGTITGRLLKRDSSELSKMLESHELLEAKAQEIVNELQAQKVQKSSTFYTGGAIQVNNQGPLTTAMLANTSQQEQRHMLQGILFSMIKRMYPDLAKTITEMLLETGNAELLVIMKSKESFVSKVQEAVSVLQAHQVIGRSVTEQAGCIPLSAQDTRPNTTTNVRVQMQSGRYFERQIGNPPQIGKQTNMIRSPDSQRPANVTPDSANNDSISAFNDIIYETTLRPGNLADTTDLIAQILQNCSGDQVLSSILHVVNTLFEKSITEQSFQCTGATIVKYLSNKLSNVPAFANFRIFFLKRCKEEYCIRDRLISNPGTVPRLCGFASLIGDLFLNSEVNTRGVKQRIPVLRFMIRDVLLVLLEHSTDDSVTCATNILKRAGAVIEETASLNRHAEGNFSKVFTRLCLLEINDRLNEKTKCSITTLLKLKSRNWDRRNSSQLRPTRSVTENEQTELESFIGSITLKKNEEETVRKDNQNSGNDMDNKYLCKLCFDNPVEVTFLPCMHVCCCKKCSKKLKVKQCPICRRKIKESRPLYFA